MTSPIAPRVRIVLSLALALTASIWAELVAVPEDDVRALVLSFLAADILLWFAIGLPAPETPLVAEPVGRSKSRLAPVLSAAGCVVASHLLVMALRCFSEPGQMGVAWTLYAGALAILTLSFARWRGSYRAPMATRVTTSERFALGCVL